MYAPVLNPLIASLAPSGMVGTSLGIFAALQTGVSAAGPLLAGVALSAGRGSLFVGVHVGISLVAVFAALRLRSLLAGARVRAGQQAANPGTACQRRSKSWSSRSRQATCARRRLRSDSSAEDVDTWRPCRGPFTASLGAKKSCPIP
jgi:MFS family permease